MLGSPLVDHDIVQAAGIRSTLISLARRRRVMWWAGVSIRSSALIIIGPPLCLSLPKGMEVAALHHNFAPSPGMHSVDASGNQDIDDQNGAGTRITAGASDSGTG